MADNNTITINDLTEIQSVSDSYFLAVDSGTATAKITVEKFNETATTSAQAYATAAAQSATNAAASELAAKGYKEATESAINDASTIVSNAQTYANAAESSKNDASGYASAASTSASQAATSAGQAASYATGVQAYAIEAKSYAEGGTGTRVDEETTNCAYYANAAHTSETNAASSESNASTSETNAALSETNASASASSASTNALKAEGYAVGSQNGVPAASGETYYHDNAKYYKEEAADSATNAASSEYNAGLSETAAAASESAAKGSEEDSEAWAWGKIDGVDVPSSHPAYHNNAKYWADAASGGASGGVTSFNGRSGIVSPAVGDYDAGIIGYDNTTSGLSASTTQDAIDELSSEKADTSSLGTAAVKDSTSSITQSSTDLIESGAVYTGLAAKADTSSLGTAAVKDSTSSITQSSTDLIESGAVYTGLAAKADTSSLGTAAAKDSTNAVTQSSTDLVESGAVYTSVNTLSGNAYQTGDTAETTLADDDYIPFYDTSASGKRKSLWSNIKSKLKTYFNSYYNYSELATNSSASASSVGYQEISYYGGGSTKIKGTKYMVTTTSTVANGVQTFTFSSVDILGGCFIDVYCDQYGVAPTSVSQSSSTVTVQFDSSDNVTECAITLFDR